MPSGADAEQTAKLASLLTKDALDGQQRSYRVILEGLASEIETADSFAIKFSLLTKAPLSKMKHIVQCLPAVIWTGRGRRAADRALALIEEAGGRGSIVEIEDAAPTPPAKAAAPAAKAAAPAKSKKTCRWCGFPMKEEESVCGFCRMPVDAVEKRVHPSKRQAPEKIISRKRLAGCVAVLLVCILLILLFLR